jgi:hypothetical protein
LALVDSFAQHLLAEPEALGKLEPSEAERLGTTLLPISLPPLAGRK